MEQWKLAHTPQEREIGSTVQERNQAFLVALKINTSNSTTSVSRHIPERFLHVNNVYIQCPQQHCDNVKSGKQFKMSTTKFYILYRN